MRDLRTLTSSPAPPLTSALQFLSRVEKFTCFRRLVAAINGASTRRKPPIIPYSLRYIRCSVSMLSLINSVVLQDHRMRFFSLSNKCPLSLLRLIRKTPRNAEGAVLSATYVFLYRSNHILPQFHQICNSMFTKIVFKKINVSAVQNAPDRRQRCFPT